MKLSARVQALTSSPIRKLSPYADAAKAAGKKVYHLNIGQPDIKTPDQFMNSIRQYEAPVIAYSNSKGEMFLLKAIQKYYAEKGMNYEIEDIFVSTKTYLENLSMRTGRKNDIFHTATLMLLDKENMTRQYIDDYLAVHHIETNNLLEISTMDLLIEFAKIGLGVACVIRQFIEKELQEGALVEIPLPFPIHKRNIGFAYLDNLQQTTAVRDFINFYNSKTEYSLKKN